MGNAFYNAASGFFGDGIEIVFNALSKIFSDLNLKEVEDLLFELYCTKTVDAYCIHKIYTFNWHFQAVFQIVDVPGFPNCNFYDSVKKKNKILFKISER